MSSPLFAVALFALLSPQEPPLPQDPGSQSPGTQSGATQQPGAATTTEPAAPTADPEAPLLQLAHTLPGDTLAMVSCNPLTPHEDALAATGFARVLASSAGFQEVQGVIRRQLDLLAETAGLTKGEFAQAFGSGGILAWTGMSDDGKPMVIAAFDLGGVDATVAERVPQWMAALDTGTVTTRSSEWEGNTIWHLRDSSQGLDGVCTIAGGLLVFATHESALVSALQRRHLRRQGDASLQSLESHPSFKAFAERARKEGYPAAGAWIRPGLILQRLTRLAPDGYRNQVQSAIRMAGFDRLLAVGYTLTPTADGVLVEQLHLDTAASDTDSLCDALLGRGANLTAAFQHGVPATADGFTVSSFNLRRISDQLLTCISKVDVQTSESIQTSLAMFAEQTGVNVMEDLIGPLGHQLLTVHWSDPSDPMALGRVAMALPVLDGWRLTSSLESMAKAGALPAQIQEREDHKLLTIPLTGMAPTEGPQRLLIAITEKHLVIATSEEDLQEMVVQLTSGTGGHPAAAALAEIPAGTIGLQWRDLDARYQGTLPEGSAPLGQGTAWTRWSGDTLNLISRSTVGTLDGLLTTLWNARDLLPDPDANLGAELHAVADDREEEVQSMRMNALGMALATWRTSAGPDADGDDVGEFTTLDQVMASGAFDSRLLGVDRGDGVFQLGGWLHTILLPPSTDAQERRALVLAWPAEEGTGTIYAVEPGGRMWSNDIALAVVGAARIEARDVFVDGVYGQEMVPGWEPLEIHVEDSPEAVVGSNTTTDGSAGRPTQEPDTPVNQEALRGALALLAQAEEAGPDGLGSLTDLLSSEHPEVATRAAWLLGKARHKPAIPALIELAGSEAPALPRTHALAALRRMPDPRALRTAGTCATDPDLNVRTQAAAVLGQLKQPAAVEDLLALLGVQAAADAARPDRVQALLALNDMGAAKALLPAATAIQDHEAETGKALTYLFQQQSPELPQSEEVQALMAVLDHPVTPLRSYAIQRLGKLNAGEAITALEARLATEGDALRPAVQAALVAIQGEPSEASDAAEFWQRVQVNGQRLWQKAVVFWRSLDQQTRSIAVAGGAFLGVMLVMLTFLLARRRRRRRQDESAEWLEPSLGHAASSANLQADYEEGYYEDAEEWPEGSGDYPAEEQHAVDQEAIDYVETDDPGAWQEEQGTGGRYR